MKISNPKTLIEFLTQHGLQAKKHSSQNFLIDGNIVRKILSEASVGPDDLVIEIGPGPGALTEALLETGCRVWAIEKDPKLAELLRRLCSDENRLKIFTVDFLEFPIEELVKAELLPGQKAKVVANLPYHITSPILTKLVPLHAIFSDLVLMVQKEVAQRCIAKEGGKDYSSLSLFLKFFSETTYGFTVEPGCFYPKPSIQSAVIHFRPKLPPAVPDQDFLFQLIRTSFQQRRKMIKASLKPLFPSALIEESLSKQGLNPFSRPEELSLEQFIRLSSDLIQH